MDENEDEILCEDEYEENHAYTFEFYDQSFKLVKSQMQNDRDQDDYEDND